MVTNRIGSSIQSLTNDATNQFFPEPTDWFGAEAVKADGAPQAYLSASVAIPDAPSTVKSNSGLSTPDQDISIEQLTQRLLNATDNGGRFVPAVPVGFHTPMGTRLWLTVLYSFSLPIM